jgi:hypothetical protein
MISKCKEKDMKAQIVPQRKIPRGEVVGFCFRAVFCVVALGLTGCKAGNDEYSSTNTTPTSSGAGSGKFLYAVAESVGGVTMLTLGFNVDMGVLAATDITLKRLDGEDTGEDTDTATGLFTRLGAAGNTVTPAASANNNTGNLCMYMIELREITEEVKLEVSVTKSGVLVPGSPKTVWVRPTAVVYGNIIYIGDDTSRSGIGWYYDEDTRLVTIIQDRNYTIVGSTTTNGVVVPKDVKATITLDNAGINLSADAANTCAFDIRPGAAVELILATGSENALRSKGESAGLHVPADATLTITSAGGSGKLYTRGGNSGGAGIGGGSGESGGEITIEGGTVEAQGGTGGAGLGGGSGGNGGIITINDGTVSATGGDYAAGIGGGKGDNSANSNNSSNPIVGGGGGIITINGGTVSATGGDGAGNVYPDHPDYVDPGTGTSGGAGIGGGSFGPGGTITISGGFVWAYSSAPGIGYGPDYGNTQNIGDFSGINGDPPAIGGGSVSGSDGDAGDITITGGTVIAVTESAGAAIGGGKRATRGSIKISGGTIIALCRPGIRKYEPEALAEYGEPNLPFYDESNDGTIGLDTDPFKGGDYGYTNTTITGKPVIFAYGIQNGNHHNRRGSDLSNGISAQPLHTVMTISDPNPTPGSGGTIELKQNIPDPGNGKRGKLEFTVPEGATLHIPKGWTLKIDEDGTDNDEYTNKLINRGTIINDGTISRGYGVYEESGGMLTGSNPRIE